jgi:hypothetical protein
MPVIRTTLSLLESDKKFDVENEDGRLKDPIIVSISVLHQRIFSLLHGID